MLLITVEILITIVAPLLVLYLTGPWPTRIAIPCLLVIPVLWYLTYAPIHELSHVLGTYVAGGTVTEVKLIPSFWNGEFGRAWITPQGLESRWQNLVMTGAPYVLDGLCVGVGYALFRGRRPTSPFATGMVLMLLCLRPTFDVVCETVAFALGGRGDPYHMAQVTGYPVVWLGMVLLMACSVFTIVGAVTRYARPERSVPNGRSQPAASSDLMSRG
jgi:hypothetical protein